MVKNQIISNNSQKDTHTSSFKAYTSSEKIFSMEVETLLDQLPHPTFIVRQHHLYANKSLRKLIGLDKRIYTLKDILNAFHPDDAKSFETLWENTPDKDQKDIKQEFRIKNSQTHQYEWFLLLSQNQSHDKLTTLTNIQQEIINTQKAKNKLNTQTEMLDASIDFIYVIYPNGCIHHMNKSSRVAKLEEKNININQIKWLDLLPPATRKKAQLAFNKALQGQISRFTEESNENDHQQYWDHILTPIRQDNNEISGILCVSRNITAQRDAESHLRITNDYDELTGLLNRHGLKKAIRPLFKKTLNTDQKIGLILIDLDHFKHVNDTFGHSAGDYVLKNLSKRFKNILENDDATIARLDGNQFAIILKDIANREQLLQISQKIIQPSETPISYKGEILTNSMSVGCAIYPDDANNFLTLLQCAETALNNIKSSGRGGIRLFGKEMLSLAKNKSRQIETARLIIRNNLIKPFYQPKIKLETNELSGVEALLRWSDQDGNVYTPDTVQEAFSDFELSSQISEIMQLKIFDDIKRWQKEGKKVVPVAINVSPVEFLRDNYAETLLERIQNAKISSHYIEIEITEHLFADSGVEYVIRALKKLRKAGIKIALDDFGTGHSSLSHLRDLPVDTIKIDYSFVKRMTKESTIRAIVEGLIKLGPLLSMNIIAEGIENKEQFKLLKEMGCHEGQGYFFNEAMNQLDVNNMLKINS